MESHDTIAAIATANGPAGVAIVRVSGPDAFAIARKLTGKAAKPGEIAFAVCRDEAGKRLDAGFLLAFAAPRSYTGEDVVEFQVHGGSVTPRRILDACFAAGARLARRGEFTERAFLNGKMDLNQAESVLDLVNARTARAADRALDGMANPARVALERQYRRILTLSATVEHALDVDESELPGDFIAKARTENVRLLEALERELRDLQAGKILREGALVVLAGAPNAGKSSLMNALLRENRAIVADEPGTTRDLIEEWLDLDGWPIRLVDTAGLADARGARPVGAVESEGIRRAREALKSAAIVLHLHATDAAGAELPDIDPARILDLSSKCDLVRGPYLNVSATTGEGLDALRQALVEKLMRQMDAAAESEVADGDRTLAALQTVRRELRGALDVLDGAGDLVLFANRLQRAAKPLAELLGATYSDDLLDSIFGRFCVGK